MKLDEVKEVKASSLKQVRTYKYGPMDISDEKLTSLKGCPEKISGMFSCSSNNLTSLEYGPKEVSGNFYCSENNLRSLEGCPKKITGRFRCDNNQITSLEGCPEIVTGIFYCSNNKLLTSLKGCPIKVDALMCHGVPLSSFNYFPKHINSDCFISQNNFASFKDIDKHINFIGNVLVAVGMIITSGYSDLFGIDGLQEIRIDHKQIEEIVNRYLPTRDIIEFQDEMIKSGYESFL